MNREFDIAMRKFVDALNGCVTTAEADLTPRERAIYERERIRRGGEELDILAELEERRDWPLTPPG